MCILLWQCRRGSGQYAFSGGGIVSGTLQANSSDQAKRLAVKEVIDGLAKALSDLRFYVKGG